jgi:hypothetical protein
VKLKFLEGEQGRSQEQGKASSHLRRVPEKDEGWFWLPM